MKIVTLLILATLGYSKAGFAPNTGLQSCSSTAIQMGFFDDLFRPVHGHGTGEKKLGKIFKEEKELQKERKSHFQKKQLKEKYSKKGSWVEQMIKNPLHFHGSGEDKLDDMYKEQQKVLYDRREYTGNKDMLKRKYKDTSTDHLNEIKLIDHDPADLNREEDEAMYVSEGFKFPWNKNLKP